MFTDHLQFVASRHRKSVEMFHCYLKKKPKRNLTRLLLRKGYLIEEKYSLTTDSLLPFNAKDMHTKDEYEKPCKKDSAVSK